MIIIKNLLVFIIQALEQVIKTESLIFQGLVVLQYLWDNTYNIRKKVLAIGDKVIGL